MSCRATLTLRFATDAEASHVARSLAPENEHHLAVRIEGATLVASAEAATPLSLLHTLDDALACMGAAQKASRLAR